jgi:hypothetical protein
VRIHPGTRWETIPNKNPNPVSEYYDAIYPNEGKWQRTVEGWFKFHIDWLYYHTWDSRKSAAGFPDLVLVNMRIGVTIYAELKTETGKVSTDQRIWLAALADSGEIVYIWRPSDQPIIDSLIKDIDQIGRGLTRGEVLG